MTVHDFYFSNGVVGIANINILLEKFSNSPFSYAYIGRTDSPGMLGQLRPFAQHLTRTSSPGCHIVARGSRLFSASLTLYKSRVKSLRISDREWNLARAGFSVGEIAKMFLHSNKNDPQILLKTSILYM
jgi:hypothetical protein